MRTVSSAASSVASGGVPEQVYYDAELRDAKFRVVQAPEFSPSAQIADTHAHLDMLHYPGLALARAAANKVSFVVSVIDPTEDPDFTLSNFAAWQQEAEEYLGQWEQEGRLKGRDSVLERASEGRPGVPEVPAAETSEAPDASTPETSEAPEASVSVIPGAPATEVFKANGNRMATKAPDVRIIMGCHPHNASSYDQAIEERLVQVLTSDERVVGIGEVGLDYHYDKSPRDIQQQVFRRQLQLAHEHESTIALHLREAHKDGLRILKEEGLPSKGVLLHCFNLDYATLEPFLELGCFVAFGGPLTFKKSDEVRDAAARCPLDRLVTETDCPFMAPVPVRGSVCEPASVIFTAKVLAGLRTEPDVLEQLYANAWRFFS